MFRFIMKKKFLIASSAFFLPVLALAATVDDTQIVAIFKLAQKLLNYVIPIVITVGFIMLAWTIIQMVTQKSAEERAQARGLMIYVIIGLFVLLSIWGLIAFLGRTLGIGQGSTAVIPCIIDDDNDPLTPCSQ